MDAMFKYHKPYVEEGSRGMHHFRFIHFTYAKPATVQCLSMVTCNHVTLINNLLKIGSILFS